MKHLSEQKIFFPVVERLLSTCYQLGTILGQLNGWQHSSCLTPTQTKLQFDMQGIYYKIKLDTKILKTISPVKHIHGWCDKRKKPLNLR
jgi:hypothetical protein